MRTSGRPVGSVKCNKTGDAAGDPVGESLASRRQRVIQSDFFLSLNLDDFTIVNHDLDGAISNAADGFEQCGRDVMTGLACLCLYMIHKLLRSQWLSNACACWSF